MEKSVESVGNIMGKCNKFLKNVDVPHLSYITQMTRELFQVW